jgi:hypothetical protein
MSEPIVGSETEVEPARTLDLTDRGVHISAEDALDPAKYRRARQIAADRGQTLVLDPPLAAAPRPRAPGTILIPRDASPQVYRQMKADAESRGLPYEVGEK